MAALLFPSLEDSFSRALPLSIVATGIVLAYLELSGSNLGYSKFAAMPGSKKLSVPSKLGMFLLYFPSVVVAGAVLAYWTGFLRSLMLSVLKSGGETSAAVASRLQEAVEGFDVRLLLLVVSVFVHFVKRDLEVLLVHRFSGQTNVGSLLFISAAYGATAAAMRVTQVLSHGLAAPSVDLKWVGLAVYVVGVTGNGYHHWLLAQLRKDGSTKYVVPRGGLFGVFVCPHYVFEVVTFVGMALMSQTLVACCTALLVFLYLLARTVQTKEWYLKKLQDFPTHRSVLVPGVF